MYKRQELCFPVLPGESASYGIFLLPPIATEDAIADKVDVIVFAQGSMAYCEQYIADKFGKVVLSSPRFGAAELKKALEKKGTI